jgi:hypothetical protein
VPRHPPYALSNLTKKSLSIQIDFLPLEGRLCIDKLVIYGKNTYLLKELILSSRFTPGFERLSSFLTFRSKVELSGIEPLTFPTCLLQAGVTSGRSTSSLWLVPLFSGIELYPLLI